MVSIGICGASGCGKSLLVKQLASLNCSPALFEGEVGTFPSAILRKIIDKSDPPGLFRWFVKQYTARLRVAKKLSEDGILCFVDGTRASVAAHQVLEQKRHSAVLTKIIAQLKLDTDVVVLLTLSKNKYISFIRKRGRETEQSKEYMRRSMAVQDEFLRLLASKSKDDKKTNVLVINRDKLDFCNSADLDDINKKILRFAKSHEKSEN